MRINTLRFLIGTLSGNFRKKMHQLKKNYCPVFHNSNYFTTREELPCSPKTFWSLTMMPNAVSS